MSDIRFEDKVVIVTGAVVASAALTHCCSPSMAPRLSSTIWVAAPREKAPTVKRR